MRARLVFIKSQCSFFNLSGSDLIMCRNVDRIPLEMSAGASDANLADKHLWTREQQEVHLAASSSPSSALSWKVFIRPSPTESRAPRSAASQDVDGLALTPAGSGPACLGPVPL